jgi:hypothetical protein
MEEAILKKCSVCTGGWDSLQDGLQCRYAQDPQTCLGPKEENENATHSDSKDSCKR